MGTWTSKLNGNKSQFAVSHTMTETSDEFNDLVRNAAQYAVPDSPNSPASNSYAYNMLARHYSGRSRPSSQDSYDEDDSFQEIQSQLPETKPAGWSDADFLRHTKYRDSHSEENPPGDGNCSYDSPTSPAPVHGNNSRPRNSHQSGNERSSASAGFITDASNPDSRPDSAASLTPYSQSKSAHEQERPLDTTRARPISGHMPIRNNHSQHGRDHLSRSISSSGGSHLGYRSSQVRRSVSTYSSNILTYISALA